MPSAAPAASPAAAVAAPSPEAAVRVITGTVLETMDASNYTYVLVKTASGEVWAASARFEVAVGDRVSVPLEMPMERFHSPSLDRDFPLIYFASQITREGEPAAPAQAGAPGARDLAKMMAPAHAQAGGQPSSAPPAVTDVIPPPEGGLSIADVWARRAALAGKTVTVGGKVVKFHGGILGRNWIHIQDGTGAAKDGTNDLTVTSADAARVGDVVTATGTIGVDKDFTAGYAYAVILEGAKVKPR